MALIRMILKEVRRRDWRYGAADCYPNLQICHPLRMPLVAHGNTPMQTLLACVVQIHRPLQDEDTPHKHHSSMLIAPWEACYLFNV